MSCRCERIYDAEMASQLARMADAIQQMTSRFSDIVNLLEPRHLEYDTREATVIAAVALAELAQTEADAARELAEGVR